MPPEFQPGSLPPGRGCRRLRGCSRVFQRIARAALGGIHADGERIAPHAGADQPQSGDEGFRAGFAGEFEIADWILFEAPMASATTVPEGLTA